MRARVAAVPAISLLRRRRCWPPACYNLFARAVLTLHSNAKKLATSQAAPWWVVLSVSRVPVFSGFGNQ